MRRIVLGAVCALLLSLVLVAAPTSAVGVPATVARAHPVGASPVSPGFPIDFVGVLWSGEATGGSVRFHVGDRWTAWVPLTPDGIEEPGGFASALVPAADADAYQVRAPAAARHPRAVAIDVTGGSRTASVGSPSDAATAVTSRATWGADESLMTWTPAYYRAQKLTVHHTATANGDPDPAATVRAIYRYHAVDRGWGDIGYQYLVDEAGRVYEGRWSGDDGDPAHDAAGNVVTAAHVAGYNSGNVGIALLGTLSDTQPTAAARAALEGLLRDLTGRHGIDPQGSGTYTNPVNGVTKTTANISGHRDWEATECPGATLQALLPSIRSAVASGGAAPTDTQPPVISGVAVSSTSTTARVSWSTDEPSTSRVEWRRSAASTSSLTATDTTLRTSHAVQLTGLSPKTKYSFRVISADASGNTRTSSWATFTTKR